MRGLLQTFKRLCQHNYPEAEHENVNILLTWQL